MPSRCSNVAESSVPPVAGSVTDAGVGSGFPLDITDTLPPVPAASTCVVPNCSSTMPVTVTSSPTAALAQLALQNTNMPSEVEHVRVGEHVGCLHEEAAERVARR